VVRGSHLVACLAASIAATAPNTALASGTDLVLVGSAARDVRLVAGAGSTSVVVRNASRHAAPLTVRFVPVDARDVFTLTSPTAGAPNPAVLEDPRASAAPLAPGASRRLEVTLLQPRDRTPEESGGELRIDGGGEPVLVELAARPPDVRFDPAQVNLDISQACWVVGGTCGDTAEVVIRGRDAVTWWRRYRGPLGSAILHNAGGGQVPVRLRDPELRDGTVRVTVDAADWAEAGRYRGGIPLEATGLSGPQLRLDGDVRWSLATAVLVVFSGAVLGGFFLRRFEIRRRRSLLKIELRSALGRYDDARKQSGARVYGFELDPLLEPRAHDRRATVPYPGTRGVSALLWDIDTASDDTDFEKERARTHAVIAAVERWLTLEPVARETAHLLEDAPPPTRENADFSHCRAYRDLAWLRLAATTPPDDDRACEQLVASLAEQGLIVSKAKVAWSLLAELERRRGWTVEQAKLIRELDLVGLEQRFPAFGERSVAQTNELRVELDDAIRRLNRLQGDRPPAAGDEAVAQATRIEQELAATKENPGISRELPEVKSWRLGLSAAFNRLAFRSLFWTFARALVTVAAYTIAIYSPTWGSVTDFASAFTAGFLTETLVNWALLPAFRSIKNHGGGQDAREIPVVPAPTPAVAAGNGQSAPAA
jgi:hypothetical protein